jgi:ABC-type polysaccharide/polyol phosphate transport system ATPase subunit
MSLEGSVRVERVWKRFRPSRRALLRDEFERLVHTDKSSRWLWALRDVSFRVEPGEAVGLVGANGSGKSTLLKILTQVMYPHSGRVQVRGKVGAMIELAAGLHEDLTGAENIFIYGSLLGWDRRHIARRFDEIVAFAELEDAIHRQVKFYSSGMAMRLSFAVAAFLDPDVLLVDEVLSVGDAVFQQRCLSRMKDVLAEGTTLVYVSHDLSTVEAMCKRAIWLEQGVLRADGPVAEVLHAYRQASAARLSGLEPPSAEQALAATGLRSDDGGPVRSGGPLVVELVAWPPAEGALRCWLGVSDGLEAPAFVVQSVLDCPSGEVRLECRIDRLPLPGGRYLLWGSLAGAGGCELAPWRPLAELEVLGPAPDPLPPGVRRSSAVHVPAHWRRIGPLACEGRAGAPGLGPDAYGSRDATDASSPRAARRRT